MSTLFYTRCTCGCKSDIRCKVEAEDGVTKEQLDLAMRHLSQESLSCGSIVAGAKTCLSTEEYLYNNTHKSFNVTYLVGQQSVTFKLAPGIAPSAGRMIQ